MPKEILITKASGETEKFHEEKLVRSLSRSGATPEKINDIIHRIRDILYPGITTKEIYQVAFDLLRSSAAHVAARYTLKKAIMELGPSGFPFEVLIGEIFRHQEYHTELDIIYDGKCVKHEVDIVAKKKEDHLIIECKYHNAPGIITGVKVPLYVRARFIDIASLLQTPNDGRGSGYRAVIATNTKFSPDAITYSECSGIELLAWNYPKNSIRYWIDKFGIYPITCLTSLTGEEKRRLLDKQIVTCKMLFEDENILDHIHISKPRKKIVREEIQRLCDTSMLDHKEAP